MRLGAFFLPLNDPQRHYYEISWTKQAMLFCAVTRQKT